MEGKKIIQQHHHQRGSSRLLRCFSISSLVAAIYTRELGNVLHGWYLIMTSPSPLVTDYLEIGGLPSAMLNAGACGMACWLFMVGLRGLSSQHTGRLFSCSSPLFLRTELSDHVALLSGPVSLSSFKETGFQEQSSCLHVHDFLLGRSSGNCFFATPRKHSPLVIRA